MTGTLGANAIWDWMPFMAGLNGEEGPHAHGNPVHGVERHMELKEHGFISMGGLGACKL